MVRSGKLIGIGGVGALLAAICCFTPALVLLLGALGLSALVGWWLDLILFPAMAIFMGVAAYGLYSRRRAATGIAAGAEGD